MNIISSCFRRFPINRGSRAITSMSADSYETGQNSNEPLINIGELIREKERAKEFYHSFELVSQTKQDGLYNSFFKTMESEPAPLFFTLTWHNYLPLDLLPNFPKNTLLHLSCRGLTQENVTDILTKLLHLGITNLLIVRGDGPPTPGDFTHALDLIEFINSRFEKKFCIAVAGYPDVHPESPSRDSDLHYLKKKVDAGASFIISQIFFDSQKFIKFVEDCRSCGISVPIIPGIPTIPNYKAFTGLERICGSRIPSSISNDLYRIKNADARVSSYGLDLGLKIIDELRSSGCVYGCHIFTFNKLFPAYRLCQAIAKIPQ